ncbi:hypothetical protein KI387_021747, partial [Taxus chinensis]
MITMAGNKRQGKYRFSLFPLFPRFQPARSKSSANMFKLKNKEESQDTVPSCRQAKKKKNSWQISIGKPGRILVNPFLKRLKKSISTFGCLSSSKPTRKLSGYFCGCHRGVPKETLCKSPGSDHSHPEICSHEYVKSLFESDGFLMNSRMHQRIEQELR